ncbi:hypothetical protein Ndes2437B_g00741 [Nannochloris sp. 'desiccata']
MKVMMNPILGVRERAMMPTTRLLSWKAIEIAVPKPNEPKPANEVGDDEVMLVSTNGGEDWTSLPHTRDLCRQCPFKVGMNSSNAKYCDRCFCYICDCPASECKEWGSGNARTHHCNATSKSPNYRTQRQERLKKYRADGARPHSAPTGGVVSILPAATDTVAALVESTLERRILPLAPTVSAGTDSPPLSDDDESEACNCLNCRRRRFHGMISMGDYLDHHHLDCDGDEFGMDQLSRSMLAAARWNNNKPEPLKPNSCNLKEMPDPLLDPTMIELARLSFDVETIRDHKISDIARRLVPHGFYKPTANGVSITMGEKLTIRSMLEQQYINGRWVQAPIKVNPSHLTPSPSEPSPTRVIPIQVHFWDGRALPTVYGVTITPGSKVKQMMDTLRAMLNLHSSVAMHLQHEFRDESAFAIKMDDLITDQWLSRNMLAKDGTRFDVFCLPKLAPATRKRVEQQQRSTAAKITLLAPEVYCNPGTDVTGSMKLFVPMSDEHQGGGNVAKAAVARNVIAALRQYRLNPDDHYETTSLASSIKISWGFQDHYHCPVFETENYTSATLFSRPFSGKLKAISLRASFTAEVMEASFLPDIWNILPIVEPTAVPSAVNPTRNYLKALDKVRVANVEERRMPELVLRELDHASEMKDISTMPANFTSPLEIGSAALVRYKAQLTPLVEETGKGREKKKTINEKKGILKIRVFVFRMPGRNRVGFFDQGSEWSGASAPSGRNRRLQRNITLHKLKLTLSLHLQHNSHFIALESHRKHWAEKDTELSARRSITGLMEAMERPEAPAAVQPNGLTVTLRPYQLQSLKFMWDAEMVDGGFRRHLWVPASAVDGTPFWYSPLLGRVASAVPEQPSGGFCCEEMGLGKTVEVLALCLANPAPALPRPGTVLPNRKLHSKATLVVCAVSLVGQWIAEAQEKTAGSLKIHMYHGQGRIKDARRLATEFDLVVTTYATLSSDCSNGNKTAFSPGSSPLHGVQWHRLVLDESHTCKNPVVGHTKACVALEAQRRWMCTGTPINTDVQDLFGQFAVLRFAPFNNKNFFDANVKNAFGNNVYSGGCPELLHALGAVMVRHTKRQELGGEQVLQLPPKTEELVPVILTATEQAVYKRVYATAAEYFSRYERMGPRYVSKNLLHIMSLLLPMRRICSGGALAERDLTVSEPAISAAEAQEAHDITAHAHGGPGNNAAAATALNVDESLVAPANEECPICMDAYEEPAVTTCNHWYCKACIVNVLQSIHSRCPLCRGPQRVNQLRCGITAAEAAERSAAENEDSNAELAASQAAAADAAAALAEREAAIISIGDGVISESKLAALLKSLRAMRRADPTAKALIFSQYNSTIEWLKGRLTREGFGHRHISGSMPLKQRAKAIQAFQGDPPTTVFLLSMRSGAVGINLTAASHVFLLEPALNAALEDQAVGRAWRMGQRREVKVVRFYVKGSVEEQIMEVVKVRQTGVAGAAAAANANNDNSGEDPFDHRQQYRPHIRVEDQAGSIKEDKQNLRLNELQALFKAPEFPEPREDEGLSEDEDEPMIDASLTHRRNHRQQQQQQQQMDDLSDGAGTSAMHAAMGSGGFSGSKAPGAGVPAAVMKNRMRRSKAGIASVAGGGIATAGATAPAATPGGALNTHTDGAGPSGANRNGTAANGVTPAATLHAVPATAATARDEEPQEEEEKEAEEVFEMAPAAILQRIKLLAQKATGRLTPAGNGTGGDPSQRAAAKATNAALAEPDTDDDLDEEALDKLLDDEDSPEPKGKKRGRGHSRAAEAITAHIPNPTPDPVAVAGGGGANGRPARRVVRHNYAVLANQGDAGNDAAL